MTRDDLLDLSPGELLQLLRAGHPLDPSALDDHEYDGTSLGLPAFVERLTWKKFRKVFHRQASTGRLVGWNVKCEQTPLQEPWRAALRGGEVQTYGYFEVVTAEAGELPAGLPAGVVIDYGRGARSERLLSPVRDPLVALEPGSADRLLGWSYVSLGPARVRTPSFFLLERGEPLRHAPLPPGGWRDVLIP
jgi:hypothetical protein